MIKVHKAKKKPSALISDKTIKWVERALQERKNHKARNHIYGEETIRKLLRSIYSDKCGYCESHINPSHSYMRIDHYRPKGRVRENSEHPGYYWLVYEWSNLISCCEVCNMEKGDYFPLENEKDRLFQPQKNMAEWKADSLSFCSEKPLFLHPEISTPENHLKVSICGEIREKNGSIHGKESINICKLNRRGLILNRKKAIDGIRTELKKTALSIKRDIEKGQINEENFLDTVRERFLSEFKLLKMMQNPNKEYSLMGKNMLKNFESFFIETLPDGDPKDILIKAFALFFEPDSSPLK